ncbi:MAG: hypothetical protein GF384_06980 [Elusimicrobia bacterium]|nr:hypothetical protein [Elusimicrobiota bacterium]
MTKILFIAYCHLRWEKNYCREMYASLADVIADKGCVLCVDRPFALIPDIFICPIDLFKGLFQKRTCKIGENIFLFKPIIIIHDQIALFITWINRLNRIILKRQLLKYIKELHREAHVFAHIIEPHQYAYLKLFDDEMSIYDCIAEWSSYPGVSLQEKVRIKRLETMTISAADLVLAVSKELCDRRKKVKDKVFYLPWAAEYKLFSRETGTSECSDILRIKKPYIGFIGNIWGIFDLNLIEHIAETMPDCSIILIGGLSRILPKHFKENFDRICRIHNVHWLGTKDHSSLPDYLRYFNVCIMPYVIDDWIKTCSPGKFYQYLAQGKSIVAVDIPEVRKYDTDIVRIAKDYADFTDKIRIGLSEKADDALLNKRKKIARENTWLERASKMVELIKHADDQYNN